MYFTRLWPLGLLGAIPVIILFYMLKKQNKRKVVSSTFLWQEICETTYADKPWQKLRNHILLILQILAVILLTLALMTPHMALGESYYKNVIFVVDNSASMNAKYESGTRLQAAKEWIGDYLERTDDEFKGSIITAGGKENLILSSSSKRESLLSAVQDIKPTYEKGCIEEAIGLAKAIGKSIEEDYEIIVLTDELYNESTKQTRGIFFGKAEANGAIGLMAHENTQSGAIVIMQVINKGNTEFSTDVSLYGEETLLDVQEVTLGVGESTTVRFKLEKDQLSEFDYLKGELALKDGIAEDNTYYYVQNESKGKKVLLVTEGNLFLEKALMALQECEVYKTTDISLIGSEEQYDLYVIDKQDVMNLPKTGNILMINCNGENGIQKVSLSGVQKVEADEMSLPDYLKHINFAVSDVTSYEVPYWAKGLLKAGDNSVAYIGEQNGQKLSELGFDLWNSDFVLKSEFPLFIYYLVDELLDTSRVSEVNVETGTRVVVHQKSIDEQLKVTTLQGNDVHVRENGFNTDKYLGVYQLEVKKTAKESNEEKIENESMFIAVNYPTLLESDLSKENAYQEKQASDLGSVRSNKDVTPYIILILLGVVLTEWYFYRKGY